MYILTDLFNWSAALVRLSHLLHRGVVKEDPFGGLGVEGEGAVVAAGVADNPHELQLSLFGMFIRHLVEELCTHT